MADVLFSNKSIQSLNLDNNDIKEPGLVALLKALKSNRTLVKLRLENNKFLVSRQLLGFLGNIFVYSNRTLRQLVMTVFGKTLLKKEQDEGGDFDRDMVALFMQELKARSNL